MRSWTKILTDQDSDIYELAGFGHPVGLGSRPAVLVIDVQYRTTGDRPVPIREAIKTMYPTACGVSAWTAVRSIAILLQRARDANVPVLFPYVAPKRSVDVGRFGDILPGVDGMPDKAYEFVREVAPQANEVAIPKRHASAFFGTALVSYLIDRGIDTLLVAGCTTSGCVRATVADAFSYNFRTAVVEECVYDRLEISHLVSLMDMDSKYADVIQLRDALNYLSQLGSSANDDVATRETHA